MQNDFALSLSLSVYVHTDSKIGNGRHCRIRFNNKCSRFWIKRRKSKEEEKKTKTERNESIERQCFT